MPDPLTAGMSVDAAPRPRTTTGSGEPLDVVVVGGGVAGVEALLALCALAGDRVALRLVSASDRLVLPALSVAEPFALGSAPSYPLDRLAAHVDAELVSGSLAAVDPEASQITLDDGRRLHFDALLLAVGATAVEAVDGAMTWWPRGDPEAFGGLLQDLEQGYSKRVAFVVPPGAVWPLPIYELALMTARQVWGMGMDDVKLTVITPEAVPLALFGADAGLALCDELRRAGIRLETATVARVQRSPHLQIVLQPTTRRLEVDRVVALPEVRGLAIPGTDHDDRGFIHVHDGWRMRDTDRIWAIGDAIAYPIKFGGLATQQADQAAAGIARLAGAEVSTPAWHLTLGGVLMTGDIPRRLGRIPEFDAVARRPIWRPDDKVHGQYLSSYLASLDLDLAQAATPRRSDILIGQTLSTDAVADEVHALWRDDEDAVTRLGHAIHDYRSMHTRSRQLLRAHGQLEHP